MKQISEWWWYIPETKEVHFNGDHIEPFKPDKDSLMFIAETELLAIQMMNIRETGFMDGVRYARALVHNMFCDLFERVEKSE